MIFAAPKLVRNAIAGNPDLALPHFNLGRVYYEREDFAPAIPAYEKAVERDPSLAAGHFALARTYKPNQPQPAARALRAELQYDSGNANTREVAAVRGYFIKTEG